ncbi:MAG: hypothetical protein R3F20_13545 [Planctomycetota bacterium]
MKQAKRNLTGGLCVRILCLALVVGVAGACASKGVRGEEESKNVQPVGRLSEANYLAALGRWAALRSRVATPAESVAETREIIRILDDAMAGEPANPLLHSKKADLLCEIEAYDEAIAAYGRSVELCPDWAPGWLGLGRAQMMRPDRPARWEADMRLALQSAEWALQNLERWGEPEPPGFAEQLFGSLLGIDLGAFSGTRAVDALQPDPAEARQTAFRWLAASMEWSPDNVALLGNRPSPYARTATRRFGARVQLVRSLFEFDVAGGDVAAGGVLLAGLDRALTYDSDFFEGRLTKAWALLERDRADQARGLLEPFTREANPMLACHGPLIELLAESYVTIWARTGDPRALADAAGLFEWIRTRTAGLAPTSFWMPVEKLVVALRSGDAAEAARVRTAVARIPAANARQDRLRPALLATSAAGVTAEARR